MWEFNERNYGALTGRTKAEARAELGDNQYTHMRRSRDGRPPEMSGDHWRALRQTPALRGLPEAAVRRTEALMDVIDRLTPVVRTRLLPALQSGQSVLIVAHGNSLRALCAVIDDLSDAELADLNLPQDSPCSTGWTTQTTRSRPRRGLPRSGSTRRRSTLRGRRRNMNTPTDTSMPDEQLPPDPDVYTPAPSAATRPIHLRWRYLGLVAAGGAIGTAVREIVVEVFPAVDGVSWSIFWINIVGALLLGLLLEALSHRGPDYGHRRTLRCSWEPGAGRLHHLQCPCRSHRRAVPRRTRPRRDRLRTSDRDVRRDRDRGRPRGRLLDAPADGARMSALLVLFIAVGGGVGAAARFLLDGLINTGRQFRLPVGTLTINITGSLLLGVVVGAASHLGAVPLAVLGTGVMGGYTTFSTASFETVRLARSGRLTAATVNGLGMLVVSVSAATVGILLGGAL